MGVSRRFQCLITGEGVTEVPTCTGIHPTCLWTRLTATMQPASQPTREPTPFTQKFRQPHSTLSLLWCALTPPAGCYSRSMILEGLTLITAPTAGTTGITSRKWGTHKVPISILSQIAPSPKAGLGAIHSTRPCTDSSGRFDANCWMSCGSKKCILCQTVEVQCASDVLNI